MSLPNTFAALTQATGQQLDQNFDALGRLTPIPCTVSGTDALTLTPAASSPSQTSYSNYKQYTFIVGSANTTIAVTARVGTLSFLNVYKDSSAGPVALAIGDLVAGSFINLIYDSALNSGAGGFHLSGGGSRSLPLSGGTLTGPLVGTTITMTVAAVQQMSVSSVLQVNGGASLVRMLSATTSLSLGALNPGTGTTSAVAVSGASLGDVVDLGLPSGTTVGMLWKGYVSAANTVTLQAFNATPSTTITPVVGSYRVDVRGYA